MALSELILARHGESEGNQARERAEADGAEQIEVGRDPDVPLTERGQSQSVALGRWLAELGPEARPQVVFASPYRRACDTARIALDTAGITTPILLDERLRDRELGILDRLTSVGIARRFPAERERRRQLGKLYYRPPGGEAWTDVALRLRSWAHDASAPEVPARGFVVAHDAVILVLRYVLENLTEKQLLDIAARESVGNAAVTRLSRVDGAVGPGAAWTVTEFNRESHLGEYGSEPTEHGAETDVHPK